MCEIVSFELAKKLKEKGFKEKCLAYYDIEDNVGLLYNTQYTNEILPCQYIDLLQSHNSGEAEIQPDDSVDCIDAPSISQVLKWLREEKQLYVSVTYVPKIERCSGFYYTTIQHIGDYTSPIYTPGAWGDYESVALVGIEYVLDNLI